MGILITKNKKAYFDYEVLEKIETGVVLRGDEVKSIRQGQINLTGSFATVHEGELYLLNVNISAYKQAYQQERKGDEATRRRKLLLHRREIDRLIGDISRKGITLVPLAVYFNDRAKVKIEIGVCKHKKSADKKQTIKERDIKRESNREMKDRF